jgi:YidC/Oxa1 family membrane protein insertase
MSKNRLIIILIAVAVAVISFSYGLINTFDLILLEPMLNFLILLSKVFFDSFGIAIIALVIIVRLLMLPISLKQLRSTKAMMTLSPKTKELQKKYGKDPAKLRQEMAKLYKESGVSPLGCVWPMLLQLPLWIALYRSILNLVAATPEALVELSSKLYSASAIHEAVPLDSTFLWLNLAQPDVPPNGYFILPVVVAASMWVLQKMSAVPSADPQQQSMSKMMLWMMPLMFGFFTLAFPSGLALFWVVSNIIGIVTQYFITGWGSLFVRGAPAPVPQVAEGKPMETPEGAMLEEKVAAERVDQEEKVAHGKSRDKRKDRRRSRRAGARKTRRKP